MGNVQERKIQTAYNLLWRRVAAAALCAWGMAHWKKPPTCTHFGSFAFKTVVAVALSFPYSCAICFFQIYIRTLALTFQ